MRAFGQSRLLRSSVLYLYLLAVALFGFAHRPLEPSSGPGFLAVGGLLLKICGDPAAPHDSAGKDCQACALAAAPGLAPCPAPDCVGRLSGFVILTPEPSALSQAYWTVVSLGSRGPPGA